MNVLWYDKKLSNESAVSESLEPIEEWVNETQLVPQQVVEEEPVEETAYNTVMEERKVPQVKSLYPFSGQGMIMAKGEVSFWSDSWTVGGTMKSIRHVPWVHR